jgi:tripartite-type tricarboxylate transporter receptor subunit TctC
VIAGRVTYWFAPMVLAVPSVRQGRLLAIGVSTEQRSADLPDVPAIAEAGVPGFSYRVWWGLWAPAGTPHALVDRISADVTRVLAAPQMRERLAKMGAEPMPAMTPAARSWCGCSC